MTIFRRLAFITLANQMKRSYFLKRKFYRSNRRYYKKYFFKDPVQITS